MHQRILRLAVVICLICLTISCAAPPALRPRLSPAPPAQDLAWLWLPEADDAYAAGFWRRGVDWQISSGDLVAATSAGQLRPLGRAVTDIVARPGRSPLATLPLSSTDQLALIDPATGAIVSERQIAPGGAISPDGTRFAARIDIPGPQSELFNALQISNISTGITSTLDVFDNSTLDYENVLHAWGPHYIYGATHDRWRHSLWWIDPDSPGAERQTLRYGPDDSIDELVFNAQADTIVYTWQPDVSSSLVTTTLMLQNTLTGETRQVGAGDPWPAFEGRQFSDLALSPDGRYFVCLERDPSDKLTNELRLYDLSQPGPPRILSAALTPWEVFDADAGDQISGEIYSWSPDSAYLLVRALPQRALIFRGGDGALVDQIDLPADTGALQLTNDLRLIMVTYQGEAASLTEYDAWAHTVTQRIPLGAQTPIIVYVPE